MHGAALCSRYPSDSSRTARSRPGLTARGGKPRISHTTINSPTGARAMPDSHDRMTTFMLSALGPLPASHDCMKTYQSSEDRALASFACDVRRAARWWAGSPGRIATVLWTPVPLDRIGQNGTYWYVPVSTSTRRYRPVQEFPVCTYQYVPVHTQARTYF